MTTHREFSAPNMAARTAAILFLFVIIFTGLLSSVYQWTKPSIAASAADERMRLISDVLPPGSHDNALLNDTLRLPPTPALGLNEPSVLYRARMGTSPSAVIFEAVAPDGYAGRIRLIIAVRANGEVAGVRVTQHRETPGLGDYIEPKKDRDRDHPWITQFDGLSLAAVTDKDWKVRKDGGRFTYHAGATVTPRAVIKAVHRAVQWATEQGGALYAETGESK